MSTVQFHTLNYVHAEAMFLIRNDPETVRWSLSPPPTWLEHLQYINKEMTVWPPRTFVAVTPDENVVAVVSAVDGRVSVMVNPLFRKEGFGRRALQWLQQRLGGPLQAHVKLGNTASLKLFSSCGFELVEANDEGPCVVLLWEGRM